MTGALKVTLACDASRFGAALSELSQLLVKAPDEFIERILALPNGVCDLVSLDSDSSGTTGTDKLTVALQPTEFMDRLMAAARAGDFDLSLFDSLGHDSSSVGLAGTSNEGRAPGESQGSSGSCPDNSQGLRMNRRRFLTALAVAPVAGVMAAKSSHEMFIGEHVGESALRFRPIPIKPSDLEFLESRRYTARKIVPASEPGVAI